VTEIILAKLLNDNYSSSLFRYVSGPSFTEFFKTRLGRIIPGWEPLVKTAGTQPPKKLSLTIWIIRTVITHKRGMNELLRLARDVCFVRWRAANVRLWCRCVRVKGLH